MTIQEHAMILDALEELKETTERAFDKAIDTISKLNTEL